MEFKYMLFCATTSDINEHLPTLCSYASKCKHVTECGVRSFVSSYAFGVGLMGRTGTRLIQVDPSLNQPEYARFSEACSSVELDHVFHEASDLDCPMEPTDLLFIDTWHVYGQMKRELSRWADSVSTYIVLHDTTVDAYWGETIRNGWDANAQSKQYNIPVDEILKGIWPAVQEFLKEHPEWVLEKRYENNNGLTILRRVTQAPL